MDINDISDIAGSDRRGWVFCLSLLLVLAVTWVLFSPAFSSLLMEDPAHITGRVEGPAATGWSSAFDKALSPVMQAIGCHDVSFEDPGHTARRVSLCTFTPGGYPAGANVKLLYRDGEAGLDDPDINIRAGIAACVWLNFSILILYRIRR